MTLIERFMIDMTWTRGHRVQVFSVFTGCKQRWLRAVLFEKSLIRLQSYMKHNIFHSVRTAKNVTAWVLVERSMVCNKRVHHCIERIARNAKEIGEDNVTHMYECLFEIHAKIIKEKHQDTVFDTRLRALRATHKSVKGMQIKTLHHARPNRQIRNNTLRADGSEATRSGQTYCKWS